MDSRRPLNNPALLHVVSAALKALHAVRAECADSYLGTAIHREGRSA